MKKISNEVLSVLSAGEIEDNVFIINCGQLDRKIYLAVNEVLTNIGGKWNRKLKGHIFECDPTEKLEEVMLTGETTNEKQLYQFFETPLELVNRMIALGEITDECEILEPSAGHGAIADQIAKVWHKLMCYEIDPKKIDVLREKGFVAKECDFVKYDSKDKYDRIIMNPPFTKQQDIDHVEKAWSILRGHGRVVSIMSPGFMFRQNKKSTDFKKLVEENGYWEELPPETFKESGTMINTVIVVLDK